MRDGICWNKVALLAAVCVALAVNVQAGTSVLDVQLGVPFGGTVFAGVDTVQAEFTAAQGNLTVSVTAARGTSLVPTVVVRDVAGGVVSGRDQVIRWLPVGNLIHHVTLPASGSYTATIGGSAGNGSFTANISGTPFSLTFAGVSGIVTNSLTGANVSGVSVLAGTSLLATTNAGGAYAGELATGSYTLTFQAAGYQTATQQVNLTSGTPLVLNVVLTPTVPVQVNASVAGSPVFGGSVTANVEVLKPASASVTSIAWTQLHGPAVTIGGANTAAATVTLGNQAGYLAELIHRLSEPAVTAEQLPPNVPLPEGEFPAGLQNRLQVVGINPFALEESAAVTLQVEVVTSLGTFRDEVEVHVDVPWKITTGLRNVPVENPVLVRAKEAASYNWTLTPPPGSLATLTAPTTRHPYFTPDIPGLYKLSVDDGVTKAVSNLEVYAGTWRGVIVDQVNGNPVSDTACTFCHNDTLAPDKFTEWEQTGHANAFSDLLDTSTYFSSNCFSCHAVGYDPGSDAVGLDDVDDYPGFLGAGLLRHPGDNFTAALDQFPESARRMNIQCENCHGPQDSNAHGFAGPLGAPRVDLSADVCASCHGEPLRHGRFQQWQLSGHANYDLAIEESQSGSCARCHTGNGFLKWLPILLDDDPNTNPLANIAVTWTEDEAHPQTCATCHDPHASGTTSGIATNATVRISGSTPPLIAGFTVEEAGRGAICMTCHNSRNGLRNDSTFPGFSTTEKTRAPHGSAQADMLMGQNAFLVEVGAPGGHAGIEDTCVTCHMESTPPPAILSYNQGGTNHTFYASPTICSKCHSEHLTAGDVQNGVQHLLDQVYDLIGGAMRNLIDDLTTDGNIVDVAGTLITDVDQIAEIGFGEARGRQAISLVLTAGGEIALTSVADVRIRNGSMVQIGTLYDFADPAIIKAGWNWNHVNNDGSVGVHNPFFANGALIAARNALLAIPDSLAPVAPATYKSVRAGRDTTSRIQD